MISQGCGRHNAASGRTRIAPALLALVLGAVLVLCGACNQREQSTAAAEGDCPLQIDVSVWEMFRRTGETLLENPGLSDEDLAAFARLPTAVVWRESMGRNLPVQAENMVNWLREAVGRGNLAADERKINANRQKMAASYRYSFEHRAYLDSLLAPFLSGDMNCQVRGLLERWIEPQRLPRNLTLAILPAGPEIRLAEHLVLLDTGLLVAGGTTQTLAQIASLLYRWHQADPNLVPLDQEGAEAVVAALTKTRDAGITAWIADRPFTYFRTDHPQLGRVSIVPEKYLEGADLALSFADSLSPGLQDAALLPELAQEFARRLTGSDRFTQLGFCMAATIDGRLGPDRLQEAARSVSDFFAAYQEAAAMNPVPRPQPGEVGHAWYASMRPFTPEVYDRLQALLTEL